MTSYSCGPRGVSFIEMVFSSESSGFSVPDVAIVVFIVRTKWV